MTDTVGALMLGTGPTSSLNRNGKPRLRFILSVSSIQSSVKCAEQTKDELPSVKSERVLLRKRTHARCVALSLGNNNQNTSGFFSILHVHPPTTHDLGILMVLALNFDTQIED